MPNRIDATGPYDGLGGQTSSVLARLSVRALDGGVAGANPLHLEECADALELLAWPASNSLERLNLWLGRDPSMAQRRARRLREALEASGTVMASADPAQAGPIMAALQKFSYYLGTLLVAPSPSAARQPADGNRAVLQALQARISALGNGQALALALVHCGAIDRIDALRGMRAGDALVERITRVLREQVLRPSDSITPLSRDEFACLLQPMPSEGVAILAAQKMLRLLDAPIEADDFAAPAEPHIGFALWPQHGKDTEELLQHAKAALRTARSGYERIALYRPDAPEAAFDESRYAARLRQAIQDNSLHLFYQPQADFRSGELIGAEALLRWNDSQLGPVPPNVAVAVAESAGMMNDLTLWIINSAIQQCVAFREVQPDFTVSINISPSNLHEADLPAYVQRALRTWNVASAGIIFEVTETAILSDQKLAMEALEQLKRLGLSIAIDDFGTGYSSMYYLAQMPLNELKIDIMFVRDMLKLPQHAKIVRSLIDLAHNLELGVVAEGVEDEALWSALRHLGCDRAQGWFVGKPMPAADLMARIRLGGRVGAG